MNEDRNLKSASQWNRRRRLRFAGSIAHVRKACNGFSQMNKTPQSKYWMVKETEEVGTFASTNYHLVHHVDLVEYTLRFSDRKERRYKARELKALPPDDPRVVAILA